MWAIFYKSYESWITRLLLSDQMKALTKLAWYEYNKRNQIARAPRMITTLAILAVPAAPQVLWLLLIRHYYVWE